MRLKAEREAEASRPSSHRVDEPTGLFLGAVASPQSRPLLHPVCSPYKRPRPTAVFLHDQTQLFFYSPDIAAAFRVSTAERQGTAVELIVPYSTRESNDNGKDKSTHRR
jgi:hypothetical protein